MSASRVLSGMRPTGPLHLGNYLGALQNWVALQEEHECFFCVVDWHALTTDYQDPSAIPENVRQVVLDWLAAGLDPERATLFVQSEVPEHAELFLLLGMITPTPWLERNPTFKDVQENLKDRDLNNYGFLGYPVLQAADILVYRAEMVPVGVDQLPHLELAREIARRFNHLYGETFPEPASLLTEAPKVPGLDGRKMSKSYGNALYLADDEATVRQKLARAVTDTARVRRTDPGEPNRCPVFDLHRIFTPEGERAEVAEGCRSAAIGCFDCKAKLSDHLWERIGPVHERRVELAAHPERVEEILAAGAAVARREAAATMERVRAAMHLVR
ncbi:MAG: tryptophan--tRNA ligase [Nitrospirae bacterium]|nr:MAG: tryptophan--tRNA ligase [Nitrospirota bacterium]